VSDKMKPEEIIERLLAGVWIVLFRKVSDDSIREMKCSLLKEYVNSDLQRKAIDKQEVLPVWDIDKNAWRSFRFDSVIDMQEFSEETVE